MAYETTQFRFPMGNQGVRSLISVVETVRDYVRYAPNQGGDETVRENLRSAFAIIRSRLNQGWSIQSAIGDLARFADSYRDM